jgi:hypothetical protein
MCLVCCIYFLGLFNSTQLNGDILSITMAFGIAEFTGVVTSPKVADLLTIKGSIVTGSFIIVLINYVLKYAAISE